ncbi:MAG TPA: hypothetical protein VGI45_05175 [Terracidiphilus sp.]|jgi:hypothetical protein
MRASRVLVAVTAVLLIETAAGQQVKPKPRWAATCESDPKRHVPYSAEFNLTNVYPGTDGNLVTYNYSETQAFDSQGRSLETTTSPDPNRKGPPQTIAVECDPTNSTQYQWDSLRKRLIVLKMPTPEKRQGCWESEHGDLFINFDLARRLSANAAAQTNRIDEMARDPDRRDPLVEDLGTMTLLGVEVQGTRTTWPPAKSSTEPEPRYVMEEHWASPLLGTWLQQEVDYPPSSEHNVKWSRRVTNLTLKDPEPSTFEPPRDYTVVTQTMHQGSCENRIDHKAPGALSASQ